MRNLISIKQYDIILHTPVSAENTFLNFCCRWLCVAYIAWENNKPICCSHTHTTLIHLDKSRFQFTRFVNHCVALTFIDYLAYICFILEKTLCEQKFKHKERCQKCRGEEYEWRELVLNIYGFIYEKLFSILNARIRLHLFSKLLSDFLNFPKTF